MSLLLLFNQSADVVAPVVPAVPVHRGGWIEEYEEAPPHKPLPKTISDLFDENLRAPYRKPARIAPALPPFARPETVRRVATALASLEARSFAPFVTLAAQAQPSRQPLLVDEIPDEVYLLALL